MHKRTAHALIDSDDINDVSLQDTLEPSSQNKNKKKNVKENVSMLQQNLLLFVSTITWLT